MLKRRPPHSAPGLLIINNQDINLFKKIMYVRLNLKRRSGGRILNANLSGLILTSASANGKKKYEFEYLTTILFNKEIFLLNVHFRF